MFKLSRRSLERLEGVDKRILSIINLALSITKIDFGVPQYGGVRSEDEQHKLFVDGKSKADGRYKKSYHQSGKAVDLFAYVNGAATWDVVYMAQLASSMLQAANILGYRLEWGGLWDNFIDMPHFELKDDNVPI
tara:strand:+ start:996 stop:1397 length:402 start_codon:yes stop_codon:yes gene_type:complete